MKEEIWKPIKGYEGWYEVSSYGRVRSADRVNINTNGLVRNLKGRILKPVKDKDGYLLCRLYKNGQNKTVKIHRLVAEAFITNPNNLPVINHKDENKANNSVFLKKDGSVDLKKSNLEWCDSKYNANYGTRNKRIVETQSKPVLQIDLETNQIVEEYPSTAEASRQLKISHSGISMCCNGKFKAYKGFKWKYA